MTKPKPKVEPPKDEEKVATDAGAGTGEEAEMEEGEESKTTEDTSADQPTGPMATGSAEDMDLD